MNNLFGEGDPSIEAFAALVEARRKGQSGKLAGLMKRLRELGWSVVAVEVKPTREPAAVAVNAGPAKRGERP